MVVRAQVERAAQEVVLVEVQEAGLARVVDSVELAAQVVVAREAQAAALSAVQAVGWAGDWSVRRSRSR